VFSWLKKYLSKLTRISEDTKVKPEDKSLSGNLITNINILKNIFENIDDIQYRDLSISIAGSDSINAILIYIPSLTDVKVIDDDIIAPIHKSEITEKENSYAKYIADEVVNVKQTKIITELEKLISEVLNGKSILLVDKCKEAITLSSQGWEKRGVERAETEKTTRGPQVAFTENIQVILGLIRRRIQSEKLKIESFIKGRYSKTQISILYIEDIVDLEIVKEVKKRIETIDVGSIISAIHVSELIEDNPLSPFETVMITERPDVITAGIMEGRVAITVDGCPTTLIVPKLFYENLITPDDYYSRFWYTFFLRQIRLISVLASTMLPAFYIAVVSFHQEVIPRTIVLRIYASRSGIPFPIFIEMLIFGIFFEGIKEAGARIPTVLGSAVSIIGTLIVGQSAVTAGFLSADGVIIGAVTAIAIYLIPNIEFANALTIPRIAFLIAASFSGLFGMVIVILILIMHLSSLRSFGIPYLSPIAPLMYQDLKDFLVRVPYLLMSTRPQSLQNKNPIRQGNRPYRRYFFKYDIREKKDLKDTRKEEAEEN